MQILKSFDEKCRELEGEHQQEYVDIASPEAQILLELHQQNYLDQSIQPQA